MAKHSLTLSLLPEHLAVCRLAPEQPIPAWATAGPFFAVTRTSDELSIICPQDRVPDDVTRMPDWRALKLEGPFDFDQVGILLVVARPLADAGVSILAVATYDTDYVLVQVPQLDLASAVLEAQGHQIRR